MLYALPRKEKGYRVFNYDLKYTYGNIKKLMKEISVEIKEEKKADRLDMNICLNRRKDIGQDSK
jgi:hypothetical protein